MIKSFLRSLRHWCDSRNFDGSDSSINTNDCYGKWRVIYPDGQRSQKFAYNVAVDYANMFKGRVVHIDDSP